MKSIIAAVAVAGLMVAGNAMASDAKMPASAAKCQACHKIDGKQVGPGWKQVSEKYKGKADAEKTLTENITKGGKFGWNMGQMPAKGGGASDADIAANVKFIIGLAK